MALADRMEPQSDSDRLARTLASEIVRGVDHGHTVEVFTAMQKEPICPIDCRRLGSTLQMQVGGVSMMIPARHVLGIKTREVMV